MQTAVVCGASYLHQAVAGLGEAVAVAVTRSPFAAAAAAGALPPLFRSVFVQVPAWVKAQDLPHTDGRTPAVVMVGDMSDQIRADVVLVVIDGSAVDWEVALVDACATWVPRVTAAVIVIAPCVPTATLPDILATAAHSVAQACLPCQAPPGLQVLAASSPPDTCFLLAHSALSANDNEPKEC
jgi:hypothetical protein